MNVLAEIILLYRCLTITCAVHFVYLTCSYPGVYTADHFRDVTKLELDPAFQDYMGEAFKPLGVYVNFFQPSIKAVRDPRLHRDDGQ